MNPEMLYHLRSMTRFLYYVTEEEDVFLAKLNRGLKQYKDNTFVFNYAFGMVPLERLVTDWGTRAHQESDEQTRDIHRALIRVYQDEPREKQNFYIFTDPDRLLSDAMVQRRFLNIAHQLHQDDRVVKIIIFVGPRPVIPAKLQRYIQVVHDTGLEDRAVVELIDKVCKELEGVTRPKDPTSLAKAFRGLTHYEASMAISQSIISTKEDATNPRRIDPRLIAQFKQNQLAKTDLLTYVDTSTTSFNDVGGNDRFKQWAGKTKASWTPIGQEFGLRPPKGVLLVGVWGCGKSLSVKAMANEWNLPAVLLEMGKLRSSAVGQTEANVYRAINLIESVAPCVVWMDEAEKSLSGGQSSAMSDAGTTSRTIGILSNWLQETSAPICLAMTANSLSTMPIEFVNRMDERFFFNLPSDDERVAILKIHLAKRGRNPDNYQLAVLSDHAKNMVGREIEQAIGAALVESFDADKDDLDEEILATQLKTKPRIFKTMAEELAEVLEWVGFDEDVNDGIRARFASDPQGQSFKSFHSIKTSKG